jgi:hypothetical protein
MKGFEFLETYKKDFNAGNEKEFVKPRVPVPQPEEEAIYSDDETFQAPEIERIPITEKIKIMLSKIFDVEDHPIVK